jgi:hypothetical protein
MTTYVQAVGKNTWHWCTNCSKYPSNIGKTRTTRPAWDLCEECKSKEKNKNCSG